MSNSRSVEMHEFPTNLILMKQRLATFTNWPYSATAPCSARKLAAAGFFALTYPDEDNVAGCWVCHKIMFWDETDDPKLEHAEHCPDCLFVKMALNIREMDLTVDNMIDLFHASAYNYMKICKERCLSHLSQRIEAMEKVRRNK